MDERIPVAAPGSVYATAFCLAALMISFTAPSRGPFWKRLAKGLGITALAWIFFTLTDIGIDALYFPLLGISLCFCFLILYVNGDLPLPVTLYFFFHAFIIGEFSVSFSWQLTLFLRSRSLLSKSWIQDSFLFAGILLTLFFIWLYLRRLAPAHARLQVDEKTLLSTAIMSTGVFLFSNVSNVFPHTPFSGETTFQINLIRMLVDGGGLILLEANRAQRAGMQRDMELEIMQGLMEAQYASFQALERSQALVHQKYHDLKHQIAYLREAVPDEERKKAWTGWRMRSGEQKPVSIQATT